MLPQSWFSAPRKRDCGTPSVMTHKYLCDIRVPAAQHTKHLEKGAFVVSFYAAAIIILGYWRVVTKFFVIFAINT